MYFSRWWAGLLLLSLGVVGPAAAQAPSTQTFETTRWISYGAANRYSEDKDVPGETAFTVAARIIPGDPWSSAASLMLPTMVHAGQGITATFWARASTGVSATVTIQGGAPNYSVLASLPLALTKRWQRYAVSGVAAADLPAGSQSLTLQLGQLRANVMLGPAAVATGLEAPSRAASALTALVPVQRVRDVAIRSESGVVLAGRLHMPTLPPGAPSSPVVLLLAGSGPSKRGVFSVLEAQLLREGIATLDYDKRGIGESTGAFDDRLELITHDAGAAVAFLRTQHGIDPSRVAIVGLSQGGIVGPALAAQDHKIAAVVMLAGPAVPGPVLFTDQLQRQLVASGMKPAAAQRAGIASRMLMDARVADAPALTIGAARAEVVEALVSGSWTGDQANDVVDTINAPYLLSAYKITPGRTLATVHSPVLALYAGEDETVSTPLSLPAAKTALRGNTDASVEEVAGMDHAFRSLVTGANGKQERSPLAVSAPPVVRRITTWLRDRLYVAATR